jgi:spermidine/putrescine-binding protein
MISLAAAAILAGLAGCHSRGPGGPPAGRAEGGVIYIANYQGYIGSHTIADFEQASGMTVVYGTYDSANTLEAWVWAGDLRYDVVSTATDFIKAGAFQPLDRRRLPNWSNLDPKVLATMPLALNYLHLDPNSRSASDYQAAERLLLAVRPYIRTFDSTEYLSNLANGESCMAMGWSSDAATTRAQLRAIGSPVRLAFTVPREGSCISYDALLIPAAAPNPEAAYRFINFVLEPRVIAAITNEIRYGNNNRAADRYVLPEILHDPTIYPTPANEGRLYQQAESDAATERIRTRAWTRVKTGK